MDIRPAATLVLVRDGNAGVEVLLLERSHHAVFLPGFHVFPGGAVEDSDYQMHEGVLTGKSQQLGDSERAHRMAALREAFEESGVLLSGSAETPLPTLPHFSPRARKKVENAPGSLQDYCSDRDLVLALDRLIYLGRWVTPPGPPRRYDTRFYLAVVPPGQDASHDGSETIDHVWLSPEQALEDHRSGRRLFVPPTVSTLRRLCGFSSSDELFTELCSKQPEDVPDQPWPAHSGRSEVRIAPGEPAYDEVRLLDPEATGSASARIRPGELVRINESIQRVTAPNPGPMTGPGTNTYILDDGQEAAIVDPGPHNSGHLETLKALTASRLRWILVTHTHVDHSAGAAALASETGAELVGWPAPEGPFQDQSFQPDRIPEPGEVLRCAGCELKVLHTPGHASNHLCFLEQRQGLLFSGDHIMQGSTVVINPPDGDMKAYVESLQALLLEDIRLIAPGHGFLLGKPGVVVDYLTTHRLSREQKVREALATVGPADLRTLVDRVYNDINKAMHGVAERSLLAHLIKLEQEGKAWHERGLWGLSV